MYVDELVLLCTLLSSGNCRPAVRPPVFSMCVSVSPVVFDFSEFAILCFYSLNSLSPSVAVFPLSSVLAAVPVWEPQHLKQSWGLQRQDKRGEREDGRGKKEKHLPTHRKEAGHSFLASQVETRELRGGQLEIQGAGHGCRPVFRKIVLRYPHILKLSSLVLYPNPGPNTVPRSQEDHFHPPSLTLILLFAST